MMRIPTAKKISSNFRVHRYTITDEYAWLRDKNWPDEVKNPEIIEHLETENEYFTNYFMPLSKERTAIFEELKGRIKLTDQSPYIKRDDYYYYTRTEEALNYSIYCRKKGSTSATEEIILDVNILAAGKNFTNVAAIAVSPKHNLMAYAIDFNGDERYIIKIYDFENKSHLSDEIPSTSGNIVWHEDIAGFFYTPTNDLRRCDTVKFHYLHTDYSLDSVVLYEPDSLYQVQVLKSESRQYIMISVSGYEDNEVYVIDMKDHALVPKLFRAKQNKILYDIEHHDEHFYIYTNNNGAQNFRLARVRTANFQHDSWLDYIAEDPAKYLTSFDVTKNYLILNYKELGIPLIKIHDFNTNRAQVITMPDAAFAASAGSANFDEDDIRVDYSSLKRPRTTYQYDFNRNELLVLKAQEIPSGFNPDEYEVERVFAKYDNVEVPITVLYKISLFKGDGSNPLYLYGYGSYGIGISASFNSTALSLVNRGFVFAIAHVRGGDELGYDWYQAAKFLNKKRTFNDFIASAKILIAKYYTSSGNIAICGGSAGGLLVGASINIAPELFKAVIAHVPFVDVLNTMLDDTLPLTPGEFNEWGNPGDVQYFEYIKSYSPYDNVSAQRYPALLVTAGVSDPRVGYWEPAKWVAKLRDLKTDNNVIIFKTNMDAGHSGASGRFDYLKEIADDLVFILHEFNLSSAS